MSNVIPFPRLQQPKDLADATVQINRAFEMFRQAIMNAGGTGGVSTVEFAALSKQVANLTTVSGSDTVNGGTGNPAPTPATQTVTVDDFTITGDGNSDPLTGTVLAAFVVTTLAFGASPYTATLTPLRTNEYRCSASSGADFVFNLPAATGSGNVAIIKKIDANAHNIAVTPNGSDTIDGVNAAVDIAIQWSVLRVVDAASGAWDTW